MSLRAGISLGLCIALLIGSVLGLNRGMVLCIDADGHYAIESAHVRHAECHEEDRGHPGQEHPAADADHAALHAALETCFDASIAKVTLGSGTVRPTCPFEVHVSPLLILPDLEHGRSLPRGGQADSTSGGIPRPEVACLSTVVLIV